MSMYGTHIPRVMQIASQIEEDIRKQQLRPGDPYLSAEEVARMLGVSKSIANRAMQLLAKRHVVHRRQRSGAVIGEGITPSGRPALRCVHLLVPENYLRKEGITSDGVLVGLQSELPGVEVQLNFPASDDDAEMVDRLVTKALGSPQLEGFVLVRAPLAVQRIIRSIELPAVIHGTLYPSVQGLPWIDFDHREIARTLVHRVFSHGHTRLLYLGRDRIFPGDYAFQDGIVEGVAIAGLPASSLVIRHLPADRELIKAAVQELLDASKSSARITGSPISEIGIIAQTEPLADGAVAAIESLGMAVGREVTLASSIVYRVSTENPPCYPHIRGAIDAREVGASIGRMLSAQARGVPVSPNHVTIPFALKEPAT